MKIQHYGQTGILVRIPFLGSGKFFRTGAADVGDIWGEQATRSHYPSIIEGQDGSIHVIYSFHRNDQSEDAKTIKYVRLAQQWPESEAPGK